MDSKTKGERFLKFALENGWEGSASMDEEGGDLCLVRVTRGEEVVEVSWRDGKWMGAWDASLCFYSLAGNRRLVRNASEARKYLAGTPDYSRRAHRVRSTPNGDTPEGTLEIARNLPWDEDADDKVILKACYGRMIVWRNSINGSIEEETVVEEWTDRHGRKHKGNFDASIYKITVSSSGRRAINFIGRYGFRSVGLDALLVVR